MSPAVAKHLALVVSLALLAGCTFNWGEGGISDVKLGGRDAGQIVNPSATNADAGEVAKPVEDDGRSQLRKVAILPVAYTGGGPGLACDLCPGDIAMKPTSAKAARLVTGFIYEAIARHPRLLFPPPEVAERAVAAGGMKAGAAQLASAGKADLVVAAALIELRPRVGPDDAPEKPAGVALYVALVEAPTGKVLWSDTFDADEGGRGMVLSTYDKVMNDRPVRYRSAEGFAEVAVDDLIENLVDEID